MLTLICGTWCPSSYLHNIFQTPCQFVFSVYNTQRGRISAAVIILPGNRCCPQEEDLYVPVHLCALDGPFESSASPNMKINGSQGMFVFSYRSVPSITSAQNILTCEQSYGIRTSICSSSILFVSFWFF